MGEPVFEARQVRSLEDVEGLLPRDIDEIIEEYADVVQSEEKAPPAEDIDMNDLENQSHEEKLSPAILREVLSVRNVREFRETLEDRAKGDLATLEKRSQHMVFLSHHKLDAGTEASLLRHEIEELHKTEPALRKTTMDTPAFLDSEDLCNLEELQDHVRNSHNVVLLLTTGVLTRPWVLVEIATALRAGVPVIPVEVRKAGNEFKYPDEKFYMQLLDGTLLPRSSMQVLRSCDVTLQEVDHGIRKVFNRISLPYSPHRPAEFRRAEVLDFLRQCEYNPSKTSKRKARRANFGDGSVKSPSSGSLDGGVNGGDQNVGKAVSWKSRPYEGR